MFSTDAAKLITPAHCVVLQASSLGIVHFTNVRKHITPVYLVVLQALKLNAHCTGFQWLVQIIHGTFADLGYISPELPSLLRLEGHTISNICLLAQGRKAGSSYVH